MVKVVILGLGNVGLHLCKALELNSQVLLLQNYNRKGIQIENSEIPVTNEISKIVLADVYIITYNDNALTEVYSKLKSLEGLVVHTSGATPMNALANFENYGVFYPVQSFNKEIPIDFSEIPIAVEANTKYNEDVLLKLAQKLTDQTYLINSEQRNALHIAAVFANNFSNFMYVQANNICEDFKIDFNILKPLITQTIQKLKNTDPKYLQTGPAIRRDSKTIDRHLDTIKQDSQKELYAVLTEAIQTYYEKEL